ncbi:hypothetical protein TrVE_jg6722 [Triparma verrucosa]|uniref:Major facilitator superfamily (MFS) profile domain-containing protein n=1 Tax=Triparma verrucosa TaxID=1606542 RepID=A0A9W7BL75_9STRA|nr:hypothetical protein TrVE_jg6722 [Triparma verrucosa]
MVSYLSSSEIWPSSTVGSLFLGELVGSCFFGPYADICGRRKSFLLSCTLIAGCSLMSGLTSLEYIHVVEFMVGVGVGGFTIPFDILSECHSASRRRASLVVKINYFWALGAILVPLIEWFNFVYLGSTWRTFVLICSLPSLVALIMGYFTVQESQIWLKSQMVPMKLADSNESVNTTISSLTNSSHSDQTVSSVVSAKATEIIRSLGIVETLSLWLIWFGKSFSYYGMVIVTSRIFYENEEGWDYRRSTMSCFSEVAGTWLTGVLADRMGRIQTMMGGYFVAGIFLMSFTMYDYIILCVIGRVALVLAVNTTWIATPEMYETKIRATGHGIANFFSRGGALIASVYLVRKDVSTETCGLLLCIFCMISSMASYMLPETKDVDLEGGELEMKLIQISSIRDDFSPERRQNPSRAKALVERERGVVLL